MVVINPKRKGVSDLPEGYTNIMSVAISAEDLHAPAVNSQAKASTDLIGSSKQSECKWLEWVYELLKKETLDDEDYISADFAIM